MDKIKFQIKQYVKMFFQHILLPFVYEIEKRRKTVKKGLVILADGHHEEMPESMMCIAEELKKRNYQIEEIYFKSQGLRGFKKMIAFMRSYAEAEYVILCDYFLPAASCKKREETTVVQLWHGCGIYKKCGYGTPEDIPTGYKGNMFGNYDLFTVSGTACREVMQEATRLPIEVIQAIGVSRTDIFFKEGYKEACCKRFYQRHKEAIGKKIIVWAPTFRGKASQAYMVGEKEIEKVKEQLGEEYYLISHLHPHVRKEPETMAELLPVIDILITDYSTILYEFLLFEKPIVSFAPDYDEYEKIRGFDINPKELPVRWAQTEEELLQAIKQPYDEVERQQQLHWRELYMSACDGHATERILDWMESVTKA